MKRRALAVVTLLVAGCFSHDPPDGSLFCNPTGRACPDGYLCAADRTCWQKGHLPDLAPQDADVGPDNDAFFVVGASYCLLDAGFSAPDGGPSLECPADRRRQGCPCPAAGATGPCWPGASADRGRGICQDGLAACEDDGTGKLTWGDCQGYTLPSPSPGSAADACACFSHGQWALAHALPCLVTSGSMVIAVSTVTQPSGDPGCPLDTQTAPSEPWTPDTLSVDCPGQFTLCYTLKAGDIDNPQASDCTLTSVCVDVDYHQAGVTEALPPLPSWLAGATSCAQSFAANGGYGEMSVMGTSLACESVSQVFNRVKYCPTNCTTCSDCTRGSSGIF